MFEVSPFWLLLEFCVDFLFHLRQLSGVPVGHSQWESCAIHLKFAPMEAGKHFLERRRRCTPQQNRSLQAYSRRPNRTVQS